MEEYFFTILYFQTLISMSLCFSLPFEVHIVCLFWNSRYVFSVNSWMQLIFPISKPFSSLNSSSTSSPSGWSCRPLAGYNSLTDQHLAGYFNNTRMRKHLVKSGLVSAITDWNLKADKLFLKWNYSQILIFCARVWFFLVRRNLLEMLSSSSAADYASRWGCTRVGVSPEQLSQGSSSQRPGLAGAGHRPQNAGLWALASSGHSSKAGGDCEDRDGAPCSSKSIIQRSLFCVIDRAQSNTICSFCNFWSHWRTSCEVRRLEESRGLLLLIFRCALRYLTGWWRPETLSFCAHLNCLIVLIKATHTHTLHRHRLHLWEWCKLRKWSRELVKFKSEGACFV